MRRLSTAHLTTIDLPPPAFIKTAAAADSDAVGLRLPRVTETSPGYPHMEDPDMMRATPAALATTGTAVNDIEFVKSIPGFDVGALLGARLTDSLTAREEAARCGGSRPC